MPVNPVLNRYEARTYRCHTDITGMKLIPVSYRYHTDIIRDYNKHTGLNGYEVAGNIPIKSVCHTDKTGMNIHPYIIGMKKASSV